MNPTYKCYPAYGKQLMEIRLSGKVPSRMVMVVFDWKLAKAYPRIVVPNNIPTEGLNFNYLAGLPVQVTYHAEHAHRIGVVSQAILAVNPCFLATLGLDLLDTGEARMLIKPFEKPKIRKVA